MSIFKNYYRILLVIGISSSLPIKILSPLTRMLITKKKREFLKMKVKLFHFSSPKVLGNHSSHYICTEQLRF